MKTKAPICPYCGKTAIIITGAEVYPHRHDLANLRFWACLPCKAYVGTHRKGNRSVPLGRLANYELRCWKKKAHSAFDPLWRHKMEVEGCSKKIARTAGYKWLAKEMGIKIKDCHIGMFDIADCSKVVRICSTVFDFGFRDILK